MAEFNHAHNPKAQTVLLESKSDLLNVSSTYVRERLKSGESVSDLMPPEAERVLREILISKKF